MTINREGCQVPIIFFARNITYFGAGQVASYSGLGTRPGGREVGQSSQLKKAESGDWKQGYCNGHLSYGEGGLNFGVKTRELNTTGALEERAAKYQQK